MAFQDRVTAYLDDLSRYISGATVDSSDNGSLSLADGMERFIAMGRDATASDRKMIMIGNGASATMASHFATDFSKNGGIRALTLLDGAMLTALSNDVGREAVFSKQVEFYAQAGDILLAISSSGSSPNIVAAAEAAREKDCRIITFTGFRPDNPLKALGDLNFHVAAEEYGHVEVAHTALIHTILDLSLGWGTDDDRNPGALKRRADAEA